MSYRGIDVDYCRAVAAGIFGSGSVAHIEWCEALDNEHTFLLLHEETVDIISGIMVNFERDVREPSTGVGFSFTTPYFFNNSAMDDYPEVRDEIDMNLFGKRLARMFRDAISDPMVEIMQEIATHVRMSLFYVSFLLAGLIYFRVLLESR